MASSAGLWCTFAPTNPGVPVLALLLALASAADLPARIERFLRAHARP